MRDDSETTRNKQSHSWDYRIPLLYSSDDVLVISKPFDMCIAGEFVYSVKSLVEKHYASLIDGTAQLQPACEVVAPETSEENDGSDETRNDDDDDDCFGSQLLQLDASEFVSSSKAERSERASSLAAAAAAAANGSGKPHKNQRAVRIVHTLDYETSGVLLLALTHRAASLLVDAFKKRLVDKYYVVIVRGRVDSDYAAVARRLESDFGITQPHWTSADSQTPIESFVVRSFIRDERDKEYATKLRQFAPNEHNAAKRGKEAVSEFKVLQYIPCTKMRVANGGVSGAEECEVLTKLMIRIYSGRRHQIRLHCSLLGHPIVGDSIYGFNDSIDTMAPRMMLHAYSIGVHISKSVGSLISGSTLAVTTGSDPFADYIASMTDEVLPSSPLLDDVVDQWSKLDISV